MSGEEEKIPLKLFMYTDGISRQAFMIEINGEGMHHNKKLLQTIITMLHVYALILLYGISIIC